MSNETALSAAFKSAVKGMSKKKQTDMIADYIYHKYAVFKSFKPLATGIDEELVAALPQYEPEMVMRVLANHCRRPRYLKALAHGGSRFNLRNRPQGTVSEEEKLIASQNPTIKESLERVAAKKAEAKAKKLAQQQSNQDSTTANVAEKLETSATIIAQPSAPTIIITQPLVVVRKIQPNQAESGQAE